MTDDYDRYSNWFTGEPSIGDSSSNSMTVHTRYDRHSDPSSCTVTTHHHGVKVWAVNRQQTHRELFVVAMELALERPRTVNAQEIARVTGEWLDLVRAHQQRLHECALA